MDANIPGYAVIKQIGEGGMATVYLAYQQNLERRVALKVLHPSLAENPEFRSRFLREAKIGASLCHRNIVPVYEVGQFRHYHFMTMEYLPNGDFKRRLVQACDVRTALRVIYDIAAALGYAHSKSYIHRDIKPENIMFREDQTAVLTDFGVALDVSAGASVAHSRQIAGSPQYMSPEQASSRRIDARSDIFGLGAVLYEALAGRPLREPDITLAEVVNQLDAPVPLLPAEVSWLQPVLDRMLAPDPDDRYDDMADVMHALEPCLQASSALAGGSRRRQQLEEELGYAHIPQREVLAEEASLRPAQAEASARPKAAPDARVRPEPAAPSAEEIRHRQMLDDLIYRDREPVLSSSAPTIVANASDDLAAALASCPPVSMPPTVAPTRPQRRSRAGLVLGTVLGTVLVLAAVPLAYTQWPALQHQLAQRLNWMPPADEMDTETLIGRLEQQVSAPAPEADDWPPVMDEPVAPVTASLPAPPALSESIEPPEPVMEAAPVQAVELADARPPAPPEPPAEDRLLQQAGAALKAPLTQESLDDAYAKFREVLARSPRNPDARQGLFSVAVRYLDLASAALNRDRLTDAQEYVDLASQIAQRHELGGQLRDKIADMQYVLNRLYQLQLEPTPQPYRAAQANWDQ